MKDFAIKLTFPDDNLRAALIEAVIGIRASESALTVLILQDIARRSRKDIEEVSALYEQLREDFQVKLLADLELNYCVSDLTSDKQD